ncbi:MAG TPA: S9 family peptidase, partial [Dehalococcoidia bacterium]|nr:S9 family peptidase [Dehalococcoidia bacterium]
MTEAPWRRRFRAARMSLPGWARDNPDRLLYASNVGGKWELYAWDRAADTHRQVTDRPEGTIFGGLDPAGDRIWWFDDERGNELGRWLTEPFAGGEPPRPVAPDLLPAYSAGLSIGRTLAVIGSAIDEGARVHVVRHGEAPRLIYAHVQHADVAGLSRDETMICLGHAERGDSRHPDLRAVDLAGRALA